MTQKDQSSNLLVPVENRERRDFGRARVHRRLPHLFIPIRLAFRVVPSRFINYPVLPTPIRACDRNYHFIRRFASVQANLSASLRLGFFFPFVDLSPLFSSAPFAFIVITGPTIAARIAARQGRRSPYEGHNRRQETRIIHTTRAFHREPRCSTVLAGLFSTMTQKYSTGLESGPQTLSHFRRIIDSAAAVL